MMTILIILALICGVFGVESGEAATKIDVGQNSPAGYAGLSGEVLVKKLLDSGSLSRAFYELWKRGNPKKEVSYEAFLDGHYDAKVVVCPQENGLSPLYVVHYGFLDRRARMGEDSYEVHNPQALFPPTELVDGVKTWDEPAFDVFESNGNLIAPFGGNNVLRTPGVLADINGDGWIERADHESYSVKGLAEVDVLHISMLKSNAPPILAVLYNWGNDEWTYRLTDADKDGIFDVELGPMLVDGLKVQVVFKWSRDRKSYVGPTGNKGDHFRVLDATNVWSEFKRLQDGGVTFPVDEASVGNDRLQAGALARRGQRKPAIKVVAKPYHYVPFKDLADDAIVHYMDRGKSASDLAWDAIIKSHIPGNFWDIDAKSAAFATVSENRYPEHAKLFRLAVDDRDGLKPPETCSIAFTYVSDRSYVAVDRHYFLRVDTNRSYLAYANSWSGGMVGYDFVSDQPAFDFRICEIPYQDAKHLAHVIWWLDRVRSLRVVSPEKLFASEISSSADGKGSLIFRNGGGDALLKLNTTMWSDPVSERWQRSDYDQEVCLNISSFLISDALIKHLGDRWTRSEPKYSQELVPQQNESVSDPHESLTIESTIGTLLGEYSPDQSLISFAIVREAARAAGYLVSTNILSKLSDIHSQLPSGSLPKRPINAVSEDISLAEKVRPSEKGWSDSQIKLKVLYKELRSIYRDTGAENVQALSNSVSLSIKKIRCAGNVQVLREWATSKEPGFQWALQRLKEIDRNSYLAALEWWVKNADIGRVRQAFDAIAQADPVRASEISKQLPRNLQEALPVSAFGQVAIANGMPDEQQRVRGLIQLALDPKRGWEERSNAIDFLVPHDQPLRYVTRDIDDCLVALFNPKYADEYVNFTLAAACRGIARRGRTEYFEKMVTILNATEDSMVYRDLLGSVTLLSQCNPVKFNPVLRSILKSQFKSTNKIVNDLFLAAWAADLRELKPELERLATSGPDDYEDERVNGAGGVERALDGRFHMARKILSLWGDENPVAQCRLLLSFGLSDPDRCMDVNAPEQLARMKIELSRIGTALTTEQRRQVVAFLSWYQSKYISTEKILPYRERRTQFVAMAKDLLKL